jgi:MHS family proline/betaine transporter-like MFS transporter
VAGAIASCAVTVGMLLGSATGAVFSALLSPDALASWGWRVPFVLGLFVGLAGFFLRRSVEETPRPPATPSSRSPLAETLRHQGPLVAKLAGFAVFNSVSFYLVFLYVASWLQTVDGIAPAHALGINTLAMVLLLPVMLAAGWLSDRVGRKGLLLGAIALGFVAAVPLFQLMLHLTLVVAGQLGMVLLVGPPLGIQPAFMVEATPPAARCTTIALGFNATFGIVGGTTPLVATWLVHRTADDLSPAFMIMGAAVISFASVLTFREVPRPLASAAPP